MHLEFHSVLARLSACDIRLCLHINRLGRRPALRRIFGLASRLGDGLFWYGLMGMLLVGQGPDALLPVLHMIGVGLVGVVLYRWLKHKTLRPRPCDRHPGILRGTDPLDEFSFPSGHTLHATAFSLVALNYYPWLAPVLVPFALLVALSRVFLGLHYPSDVLAGAAIGAAIASLSFLP